VILVNGALAAYLARGDRQLTTFLPDAEPERSKTARAVARALIDRARGESVSSHGMLGMLIEEIDGLMPSQHALAPFLGEAGFVSGAMGMQASPLSQPPAEGGRRPPARGRGPARTYRAPSVSSPFARRYFDVPEASKAEPAKDDERDG
jgi:ATP-dependent Lhr-like helicase